MMTSGWDREREAQKQNEIKASLKSALVADGVGGPEAESLATEIYAAYVTTNPPEKEPAVMQLMTISSSGDTPLVH